MGILFDRVETRAWTSEPIIPAYPGAATGRSSVSNSSDLALTVPTVWACVGLLANAVSMLQLETFRRSSSAVPIRIADSKLVMAPAADMTQSEWLHMLMVSLLLRGNAIGHIVGRDAAMYPTQIELLNPDTVRITVDKKTGDLTYTGTGGNAIKSDDIWHVRGLTVPGSKIGLSPIAYAAASIGIDLSSRHFAAQFFDGGGIPKAVLTTDQAVNQDQARTIKERLLALTHGREPLVLGQGFEYKAIQISPDESQFLATLQANVAQIARFFWVPAEMVGGTGGSSMTYSNSEQKGIDFLTYSVSFWLKRIEDAMFSLFPQPQYVRFNSANLLRTDAETAARIDVQLIAGKIKTPTEVRQSRNLPPMTPDQLVEADLVPLTVTPTGAAKALPPSPMPAPPVEPAKADPQFNSAVVTLAAAVHESSLSTAEAMTRMASAVQDSAGAMREARSKVTVKSIERDEAGHLKSIIERES